MISESVKKDFDPRTQWRGFLLAAGVFLTSLFVLLMPLSSSAVTGLALVAFWTVHVFAGLLVLQAAQMMLMRYTPIERTPHIFQVVLGAGLGALLFAPFALFLDMAFGVPEDESDLDNGLVWAILDEFAALAPVFVLVWFGLNATRLLRLQPASCGASAQDVAAPAFWDRTPNELGRDLVALSAELHYTRVYTTQGDALILYSFGKAVNELNADEGFQIHRSHWVAHAHIRSVTPRGQGALCQLSNGLSLPVSRGRKSVLDEVIRKDT